MQACCGDQKPCQSLLVPPTVGLKAPGLLYFSKVFSLHERRLKFVIFYFYFFSLIEIAGCNPSDRASLVPSQSRLKFKEVANKTSAPAPWQKSAELSLFTRKAHCLGNSLLQKGRNEKQKDR